VTGSSKAKSESRGAGWEVEVEGREERREDIQREGRVPCGFDFSESLDAEESEDVTSGWDGRGDGAGSGECEELWLGAS
jgi:hypothetical protein